MPVRNHTFRAVNACAHILALSIWLAATLGSAMAAAVIFPAMKSLSPRLPDFPAQPDQHWLVAGGSVAQRVFLVADYIQFPAALIAAITLALGSLVLGEALKRPAGIIRMLAVGVAVAALASLLFIVTPQLIAATKAHFAAIQANDIAAITRHKAAVDDIHPIASRLMGTMGVSTLVALAAAVWCMARPLAAETSARPSVYEEPRLARGGRL